MILLNEMKLMSVKWIQTLFLLATHPVYPQYTHTHTNTCFISNFILLD